MLQLKDFAVKNGEICLVLTGDIEEAMMAFAQKGMQKGFKLSVTTSQYCEVTGCSKSFHLTEGNVVKYGNDRKLVVCDNCLRLRQEAVDLTERILAEGREWFTADEAKILTASMGYSEKREWEANTVQAQIAPAEEAEAEAAN